MYKNRKGEESPKSSIIDYTNADYDQQDISDETTAEINDYARKYEKKLQQITRNGKKDTKQDRSMVESGKRINFLRTILKLTLEQMASLCNLHLGKFTRLEHGHTPLTREDAIRICLAVIKNFGILITSEWLLGLTNETPISLISTDEVKARVREYTEKHIINRGVIDTITIFLETENLGQIHGPDKTVFLVVNDNRMPNRYQKGDYVGGFWVKPELYYVLDGQDCIISFKSDPDVKFVRTLYFKPNGLVILCTETRPPEVFNEEDVHGIAFVFYRRKNSGDFTKLINIIHATDSYTTDS